MTDPKVSFSLPDNGGRRSGIDRRNFSYTAHIPERRLGLERRSGRDRRDLISSKVKGTRDRLTGLRRKTGRRLERRVALKQLPTHP